MRGESILDQLVYGKTIGWYCFPPMDPITGEISAKDDSICVGELKHCDLPVKHRREDCNALMQEHYWISNGTREGVVVCPMGLFIPEKFYKDLKWEDFQ